MGESNGHRVVALINHRLHMRETCATLIKSGINLVGIFEADTRVGGLPLRTLRNSIRKSGLLVALSQIAMRLVYMTLNRNKDKRRYAELFDRSEIEETLANWGGPIIRCTRYDAPETLSLMTNLRPDILLVHSQTWVPKITRELSGVSYVIGGHPGITPQYRGSHSSFWALYNQDSENLGWSVFHLDEGVDTGDVIAQGHITAEVTDSFNVINWQAMRRIADKQAEIIAALDRGDPIPRKKHASIPEGSEYPLPTLKPYLKFLLRQLK